MPMQRMPMVWGGGMMACMILSTLAVLILLGLVIALLVTQRQVLAEFRRNALPAGACNQHLAREQRSSRPSEDWGLASSDSIVLLG